MVNTDVVAYGAGIGAVVVVWIIYRLFVADPKKGWSPMALVEGSDGRPSTSKFQWFVWTVVAFFSYTSILAVRAANGQWDAGTIPQNLLVAMGLSAVTMTAAKAITVGYVNSGQVVKTSSANDPGSSVGALFKDDSSVPDLSKVQLLAWTGIGVAFYLAHVVAQIGASHTAAPQMPDIDPTLTVLMGLGQGAYLGKKLMTTNTPRLTGLSPSSAIPPCDLTISGMAFGDYQNDSLITVDGVTFDVVVPPSQWKDVQIKFSLPATHPDGTPWQPGHPMQVGLIVGGQSSTNTLPFTAMSQPPPPVVAAAAIPAAGSAVVSGPPR